jgi:hypothetical protein
MAEGDPLSQTWVEYYYSGIGTTVSYRRHSGLPPSQGWSRTTGPLGMGYIRNAPTAKPEAPRGTPLTKYWIRYEQRGGKWWTFFMPWPPPKPGDPKWKRVNPPGGDGWGWMEAGGSSSNSAAAAATGTGTGTGSTASAASAEKKKKGPTRPPYWRKERYFDARQNKWRWRWRYLPTNDEVDARRRGLAHDARGYYRSVNGRRQYVTGRVGERRFHWETRNGKRTRIWDDPARWPRDVAKQRRRLQKRIEATKNKLESLREQYKRARSDNHTLKRNIKRRIRQLEGNLQNAQNTLRRLPSNKVAKLDFTKRVKYVHGLLVTLDFDTKSPNNPGGPLNFKTKGSIGKQHKVFVRATIHIGDREWKPGRVGMPEMLRVKWTYPGKKEDWRKVDDLPLDTDEYMVSNPLQIIRVFKAPDTGNTFTSAKIGCKASIYEYFPTEPTKKDAKSWHKEKEEGVS